MKRKYGDRSGWKRVLEREYTQSYLDEDSFKGYLSLLKIVKQGRNRKVQVYDTI